MDKEENILPELANPADKSVLIVDDDEGLLDLLQHIVEMEGFKVHRAGDGNEALRLASALRPDLIILDFMLPGLSGLDLIKALNEGDLAWIPIVIVTGRRIDRAMIEKIRSSPNVKEYMEKPIRPAALGWTAHRILRTRPGDINRIVDRGELSGSW